MSEDGVDGQCFTERAQRQPARSSAPRILKKVAGQVLWGLMAARQKYAEEFNKAGDSTIKFIKKPDENPRGG